jgi:serine/threonine protein kinase
MDVLDKKTLGKYDVVREIGKGGMATVYFGRDPINHRDVAIKIAHPEMLQDSSTGEWYREMFFNEAKVAGVLKHPNIVSVYDAGFEGDLCYIAMEYVGGDKTLKTHCDASALLPIEDVVQIIFHSAKALDHAHRHGVVHRDVKPANILLTEDRDIKLVDFGIALFTHYQNMAATQLTRVIGSPLYMSPEQILEDDITTQSDLFSLGAVMYEMLTGTHPFLAENLPAIVHRITKEAYIPIAHYRSDVPPVIEHIVRSLLEKRPEDRYRTGLDLAADLSLGFDHLTLSEQDLSDKDQFNLVRDLAFFSAFSESEICEVIDANAWEEFQPGATIISEGELDSSFYIIVSGDATVRKAGADVYTLTRGECFGEMGFITRERRTATVVANNSVWVMKVRPSLIERTSAICQLKFHKVFLSTLATRLKVTTEKARSGTARTASRMMKAPRRGLLPCEGALAS